LRIAYDLTVLLEAAIDEIRIFVVDNDMIELRDRQILALPPFAPTVIRVPHPAIVTSEHRLRISWINPDIMRVTVRPLKTAYHSEAFTPVLTQDQRTIRFE